MKAKVLEGWLMTELPSWVDVNSFIASDNVIFTNYDLGSDSQGMNLGNGKNGKSVTLLYFQELLNQEYGINLIVKGPAKRYDVDFDHTKSLFEGKVSFPRIMKAIAETPAVFSGLKDSDLSEPVINPVELPELSLEGFIESNFDTSLDKGFMSNPDDFAYELVFRLGRAYAGIHYFKDDEPVLRVFDANKELNKQKVIENITRTIDEYKLRPIE